MLQLFRSMVHGILQAACCIFMGIPLLGFSTVKLVIRFMNAAIFGFAWTGVTFGAAIMVASSFDSSHVVLVMNILILLFCRIFFFMSRLYFVFKLVHYLNPFFYISSASASIIYGED